MPDGYIWGRKPSFELDLDMIERYLAGGLAPQSRELSSITGASREVTGLEGIGKDSGFGNHQLMQRLVLDR